MEIGGLEIEVVKKDIKNIHLAVYPPLGKIRLASPRNVSDETIRLYAISKLSWIKKQQRKFVKQDRLTDREYINRETYYLFGRKYLLKLLEEEKPSRVKLKNSTILELSIKPGNTKERREKIIEDFYRDELRKRIQELLEKWQQKTGIKVDAFGIKKMKTKWGTCNIEAKRIWINLELAKKPIKCLEYIVVHEMVHLLERKHNDVFMSYMDQFLPNWRSIKTELNRLPVSHLDWEY